MKNKFIIKPQDYGFPSKIGGLTIKTISWKDFPAKPPQDTWFLAYTYWNTNYTCINKNGKGSVLATVAIGPKAWTRAKDDFKLLQHQTGHYWIACLCALQFQKRVNYTEKQPSDMSLLQWSQAVLKRTSSQFSQQQKRYDKQTYHYLIQQEQKRWNKEMIAKFNQYHVYFQQKKQEESRNQALVQAKIKQNIKNNANQRIRNFKNLQTNQKEGITQLSKQSLNKNLANQKPETRTNKQFSVRRTNPRFDPKKINPTQKAFEKARNTLLGNINLLEGIK